MPDNQSALYASALESRRFAWLGRCVCRSLNALRALGMSDMAVSARAVGTALGVRPRNITG